MGVVFFVFNLFWGVTIPLGLQLLDRESLTHREREWVWGFASWGSALYNFGPLSLVAWGYVTRSPRYLRGLGIGVALIARALVAQGLLCEGFGRLVGMKAKELEQNRLGIVGTMLAACLLAVIVGVGRAVYEAVRKGSQTTAGGAD